MAVQFRAFTSKSPGRIDRILSQISVFPAFDPENPPVPYPQPYNTLALWDTGATKSVLTSATVQALNLVPVSTVEVNHGGGTEMANAYIVNLWLPNQVGFPGVLVTESDKIRGNFGAIIGMDIIAQGDFSITNVGNKTVVSYRHPSIQTIDYVEEARQLMGRATGRNDPCPCGSGKKFKKCCLDKPVPLLAPTTPAFRGPQSVAVRPEEN
jgi:hypothetical protein